jgi:hypothetical protein
MDFSQDQAYLRAYSFKVHQKKLEQIKKTPTKRLDNRLPDIFLKIKKRQGYKGLWWSYKINKENQQLLNRLIQIKEKKRSSSKTESINTKNNKSSNNLDPRKDETFTKALGESPESQKTFLKDYKNSNFSENILRNPKYKKIKNIRLKPLIS